MLLPPMDAVTAGVAQPHSAALNGVQTESVLCGMPVVLVHATTSG